MSNCLDTLPQLPPDAILSLMVAFRDDPAPRKVDLTVGVYKDRTGNTPIMRAVAAAERMIVEEQTTKVYTAPAGVTGFIDGIAHLVFGDETGSIRARAGAVQTPGGCGALRVGAELLRRANPEASILLGDPTWPNHMGLLGGAGLKLERYDSYASDKHAFDLGTMLEALARAAPGTIVLLQASCCNPTGADPTREQWGEILQVIGERGLVPFFDLAYPGLGSSLEADVHAIRAAARSLPEFLVAASCSKCFGLYRERTGALFVVAGSPTRRGALQSQVQSIARTMYSVPPAHGALLVDRVLADPALRQLWQAELAQMGGRLQELRAALVREVHALRRDVDLSWLARQRGMFSLLGLGPDDVTTLRERDHIYMLADSRVNIAGLNEDNVAIVARAIAPMLRQT